MTRLLDFTVNSGKKTVTFTLYNRFDITIPIEEWEFMCQKRWFSDTPTQHEAEVEFGVCGAEDASDNDEANEIVRKIIEALHGFIEEDTVQKSMMLQRKTPLRLDQTK